MRESVSTPPFCVLLFTLFCTTSLVSADLLPLTQWQLVSSTVDKSSGEKISTAGYPTKTWYPVTVPATVMAGLIQNGLYKDVFFGTQLKNVSTKQFSDPWWYRTEFNVPSNSQGKTILLTFKGINYRANVFFNGKQIGNQTNVVGTFRYFDFDVTKYVQWSSANAIAVEIYQPNDPDEDQHLNGNDLAITFVDWAPLPPDANMGLWQDVLLSITGPVTVRYPLVTTTLASLQLAHLSVLAELTNHAATSVTGTLQGSIVGIGSFQKSVTLTAGQTTQVTFANTSFPVLDVKNPNLWWPAQMGTPTLQTLTLTFTTSQGVSDTLTTPFGIRQVTSVLDSNGHRVYSVNGKQILIRGAGWAPDLFQRTTPLRQDQEMRYVQHMGLNTVRLEGKFENDNLFDLADQYGILMMPGICCCDAWQNWGNWKTEQHMVAQESVRSQVKRLRIHPSNFVFVYSSDELPPVDVETQYLAVFSSELWPNPLLASAADTKSTLTGKSGVKMSGPYSWVPPNYWLVDTSSVGGAFGFLTEGGPGESPLTLESFKKTIPASSSWPIDDQWNYHCGASFGNFGTLKYFTTPLVQRYGTQNQGNTADYLEKSQVMAYEGMRAMFEAYSRNKYTSTGVIQWMLNNAWPEMIWHVYDYFLNQGGGYYATKKACEPVHILYSYNDQSIWIVNSQYTPVSGLRAVAEAFDLNSNRLYTNQVTSVGTIAADGTKQLFVIPPLTNATGTYFVRLQLFDSTNKLVSNNFYWLSKTPDVLDFKKSTWYNTPCTSYANFLSLQGLRVVALVVSSKSTTQNGVMTVAVTVTNPLPPIAFFIRVRITKNSGGDDVLPIFWDDNYFSLLPNESQVVTAMFNVSDLGNATPFVVTEVYNNISGNVSPINNV